MDNITNEFRVIEDNNNYVILENKSNKFVYYDENKLKTGNTVHIKGKISRLDETNEFNNYLKTQNIHYEIIGEIISNNDYVNLNLKIIDSLLVNKDEENSKILRLILFNGKNDENIEFYNYFAQFSLSFLVVISGFHINLLFKILDKFKILKYFIVGFYLYLLNLSISSLKAFLYYILKKINSKSELTFNNSDLLSFILIALLFVNPSYCFNMGFIFTFIFSYSLDLINNVFVSNNFKSKLLKKGFIYLISVPLIILNNYEINIFSFFMTIIFEIPISILFVFSILYLFFDKFYFLYKLYTGLISYIFKFVESMSIDLVFGEPNLAIVLLLYLSLFLILYFYENKMKFKACIGFIIYIFVLTFQYSLPILDSREIVYFLDVGQGDCSVLKIKNTKSVALIDTGGSTYFDIANSRIIPFLKKKGINVIEKIIITHDDYDHNGAKDSLIDNFTVKSVIENSSIEEVVIGNKVFKNLNVNAERDNDGSIVLYGKYGGISYLFSGDISFKVEKEIIDNYELEVDILKVSHHGASSSSCEEFINTLHPKVALIGVGKNNIYKHPTNIVLERLESINAQIFRTDIHGNISVYKSIVHDAIVIEKEK